MRNVAAASKLCAVVIGLSRVGLAQAQSTTDDQTMRQSLLRRISEANARGDHQTALDLAQQAAAIQLTPTLMLFIAEQHEQLAGAPGSETHLVHAALGAELCVRTVVEHRSLPQRDRILVECSAVLDRVNPRLARVRIVVPRSAPPDLVVRVNEQVLPTDSWGLSLPMLPGAVAIVARSQCGFFRRTMRVSPGSSETVAIDLSNELDSTDTAQPLEPTDRVLVSRQPDVPSQPWRTAAWLLGAGTALAGTLTIAYGLLADARYNDLARGCGQTVVGCRPDDISDMSLRANVVNGGIATTSVLAAAAVTFLVIDLMRSQPQTPAASTGVRAGLVPTASGAMLTLGSSL